MTRVYNTPEEWLADRMFYIHGTLVFNSFAKEPLERKIDSALQAIGCFYADLSRE